MVAKRAKFLGWGYEGEGLTPDEQEMVLTRYAEPFGVDGFERIAAPTPAMVDLHGPRIGGPANLEGFCSTDDFDRLNHTYGKSFPEYA
ncbi:MAG: FAD-binding oxidoreductase, partial [Alphaproteobacteria bacterium]|nr:FAD-binding oxidoreductase [Alphaproteobacteria bacterium]